MEAQHFIFPVEPSYFPSKDALLEVFSFLRREGWIWAAETEADWDVIRPLINGSLLTKPGAPRPLSRMLWSKQWEQIQACLGQDFTLTWDVCTDDPEDLVDEEVPYEQCRARLPYVTKEPWQVGFEYSLSLLFSTNILLGGIGEGIGTVGSGVCKSGHVVECLDYDRKAAVHRYLYVPGKCPTCGEVTTVTESVFGRAVDEFRESAIIPGGISFRFGLVIGYAPYFDWNKGPLSPALLQGLEQATGLGWRDYLDVF